jgi:NAD+ kinase
MEQIAVLFNPRVTAAEPLAAEVAPWLAARECRPWVQPITNPAAIQQRMAKFDLLVILGGDGSTLLASRLAAPHGVPIFGINLGRVGFLSEASPEDWPLLLARVLAGDYWREQRLMLQAVVRRGDQDLGKLVSLNDVVVSRGAQVRVVRFHLFVDGDHVTSYTADGLIAATPTGSTAYSMAAGGPLLPPQLQNFLVLPVAPHLSFERALVLHQEAVITIQVSMEHEAIATADGQQAIPLQDGDEVIITKHDHEAYFARVNGPSYFYNRLMQRLSFWSRKSE